MTLIDVERPRVLVVDDEAQVTRSLGLVLRKGFDVTAASSGEDGLVRIETEPEFDVVVSDMRMPGMNGAEFLKAARSLSPDSVRILLTGQADAETAMAAVNEGRIFRFLHKPCSPKLLRATLDEALAQRAQKSAERDVLERTLRGLGLVLSEVIGTIHPLAAHHSERMRSAVAQVAEALGLADTWRFELAAALSHLGCVALPPSLIDAALRGETLDGEDLQAWVGHPVCGAELIEAIPRLDAVADIIRGHGTRPPELPEGGALADLDDAAKGSELLRTVSRYITLLGTEGAATKALSALVHEGGFLPEIIDALRALPDDSQGGSEATVRADRLREGMRLLEDLTSREGVVLACAGAVVSDTLRKLAFNFSVRGELREPIRVLRARDDDSAPGGATQ